jgi:hypothetical protein
MGLSAVTICVLARGEDRRKRMARTGPGFVVGVLVGGLGGFAAGYLLSRDGQGENEHPPGSIDLTPTIELKDHRPVVADVDPPATAEEKPA